MADRLIDWIEFYAVSTIFQPCNGGMADKKKYVRAHTLYYNMSYGATVGASAANSNLI